MIQSGMDYDGQIFRDLEMVQAQLSANTFDECRFEGCHFNESLFQNCRFVNTTFKNCDLSLVQIPDCSFPGTRFENSKMIGINWAQATLPEKALWDPLVFKRCALNHSTFLGVNLRKVQMRHCEAVNVDFREADLGEAAFPFTDLKESLFSASDLSGADLSQARNYQIDPSQNKLKGAKFSLPEAMSLLYSMDIEIIDG